MATLQCMQPKTASTITIVKDVNSISTAELVPCSRQTFFSKARRHRFTKLELSLIIVILLLVVAVVLTAVMLTQKSSERCPEEKTSGHIQKEAIESLAQIFGNMDDTADPCVDFYQYACGGWLKKTYIDDSDVSVFPFKQAQKENRRKMKEVLENTELRSNYSGNAGIQKAFDMYSSCMNTSIEMFGDSGLKKLLSKLGVRYIKGEKTYQWHEIVINVKRKLNIDTLFRIEVLDDLINSSIRRIVIRAVQLGLDHQSYTAKNLSQQSQIKRRYYVEYMTDLMEFLSHNRSMIRQDMERVLDFESEIAKTQLAPDQRSNFSLIYNLLPIRSLPNMTSQFDWLTFFRNLTRGAGYSLQPDEKILITSPKMIREIIKLTSKTNSRGPVKSEKTFGVSDQQPHASNHTPSVLSNYIAWKIVHGLVDVLPKKYRQAYERFRSKVFNSELQVSPRWVTCVEATSKALPLSTSVLYAEQILPRGRINESRKIVNDVKEASMRIMSDQVWLDEKTRLAATEKVRAMIFHVGYPDDISKILSLQQGNRTFMVSKNSYLDTYVNLKSFEFMENFRYLKSVVNRNEYEKNDPLTPTAFYYHTRNKVGLSVGILRNPFYYGKNYNSLNFGALGISVGHEITHGFDLRGHQFDKNGRQPIQGWMSRHSSRNVSEKTSCFREQYNSLFKYKGRALKGNVNVYREAFSDAGGLKLAYKAYKHWKTQNIEEPIYAGGKITNDQIFFLSYAQMWCAKYKEPEFQRMFMSGSYLPFIFRVKGTLMNSPDFAAAFSCPSGSPMNPEKKCEVW